MTRPTSCRVLCHMAYHNVQTEDSGKVGGSPGPYSEGPAPNCGPKTEYPKTINLSLQRFLIVRAC
jgi:hypothetical protein